MTNYISLKTSGIKKDYIDAFEDILNNVILNHNGTDNNYALSECKTEHYACILGLIVDERNRNERDKFYSILDDTDVILDGFDVESFFKNKRRKIYYDFSSEEPGPIDPLRADFDV
jgi:hypothetical protein